MNDRKDIQLFVKLLVSNNDHHIEDVKSSHAHHCWDSPGVTDQVAAIAQVNPTPFAIIMSKLNKLIHQAHYLPVHNGWNSISQSDYQAQNYEKGCTN